MNPQDVNHAVDKPVDKISKLLIVRNYHQIAQFLSTYYC